MSSDIVLHTSGMAVLLIDVINHFEFPDGQRLYRQASPIGPRIARLKARAHELRVPVLYVNDNFGQWGSDAKSLLRYCVRPDAAGRRFVETVRPCEEDYFVLKPMHSAFYQSPLEVLLRELRTTALVIAGLATHSCVASTANDAGMRNFKVIVVSDCCAARSVQEHRRALQHIRAMGHARVVPLRQLRLSRQTMGSNAKRGARVD